MLEAFTLTLKRTINTKKNTALIGILGAKSLIVELHQFNLYMHLPEKQSLCTS